MLLGDAIHKRRKIRQNASSFKALIATPATAQFRIPQGARVKFVATTSKTAGSTAGTIVGPFPAYSDVGGVITRGAVGDRTIKTPALAVGESVVINGLVARAQITPASGFDCYVDIGLNRWRKIASIP